VPCPLLDRPALNELREDAKTDVYDVIYFLDADRIARVVAYQTIIIEELLKGATSSAAYGGDEQSRARYQRRAGGSHPINLRYVRKSPLRAVAGLRRSGGSAILEGLVESEE
jgi:hypothetical protein